MLVYIHVRWTKRESNMLNRRVATFNCIQVVHAANTYIEQRTNNAHSYKYAIYATQTVDVIVINCIIYLFPQDY